MRIRDATPDDAVRVSALIHALTGPLLVSPDGRGAEPFLESISAPAIAANIANPRFRFWVAQATADELAGVVALRDSNHLYHLFVAAHFQRSGVASRLWARAHASAQRAGNPGNFTVNASLGAMPVYGHFGFVATGPEVRTHGVVFVPMRLDALRAGD
jgi:GNAT superfamily N-acetyltransferase